jgi:hypothetical protein
MNENAIITVRITRERYRLIYHKKKLEYTLLIILFMFLNDLESNHILFPNQKI